MYRQNSISVYLEDSCLQKTLLSKSNYLFGINLEPLVTDVGMRARPYTDRPAALPVEQHSVGGDQRAAPNAAGSGAGQQPPRSGGQTGNRST